MKKRSTFATCLLIGLFILSSCENVNTVKTTVETDSTTLNLKVAKKEIEEANRNFMDLVAKGDSVGLANAYTIDAKFMNAGAPAVVGRANIQKAMSGIIKSGITKADIRLKEVYGTEDLIAEEGELTLYVKDMAIAEEKYIVLWKKEDGKWKLFRDIFNSSLPAPALK